MVKRPCQNFLDLAKMLTQTWLTSVNENILVRNKRDAGTTVILNQLKISADRYILPLF